MRTIIIVLLQLLLVTTAVRSSTDFKEDSTRYNGFVIALAWPKAWAKEAGDGYDRLMRGLGFNDGGFYRVGHAALVLINVSDSSCHYFDFGRYHSPVGKGRVRDAQTDHELKIGTKAIFEGKRINNLDAILCETQANRSTHASGPMYASYVRINFQEAYTEAKSLQNKGFIPYGPFEKDGLNCSRFVREVILAGEPNWAHALRLEAVPMITPTTLYPVSALYHWVKVSGCLDDESEEHRYKLSALPDSLFCDVLPQPDKPSSVPSAAQWLAGESSGSWFHVVKEQQGYLVSRFSMSGLKECEVLMKTSEESEWNGEGGFKVTYPSHCAKLTLETSVKKITLIPEND